MSGTDSHDIIPHAAAKSLAAPSRPFLLGYEALSAGLWYVSIDLQLFMLLATVLWLGERASRGWAGQPARVSSPRRAPLATGSSLSDWRFSCAMP